jgi:hypothetical protein
MQASDEQRAELEAEVAAACREAGLTPRAIEVMLYWLIDGLPLREIRLKLHLKRTAEVRTELGQALAKLAKLPGFWSEARAFPHRLVFCAHDRRTYDERPPGMRGVEPDRASDRLHTGLMVPADDRRLRQDVVSAARLWVNGKRSAA